MRNFESALHSFSASALGLEARRWETFISRDNIA